MPYTFTIHQRLHRIAIEKSVSRRERITKAAATKAARHAEQRARAKQKDEQRMARLTYTVIPNPNSHNPALPWAVRCEEDGWIGPCRSLDSAWLWRDALQASPLTRGS